MGITNEKIICKFPCQKLDYSSTPGTKWFMGFKKSFFPVTLLLKQQKIRKPGKKV
jgi:hypothetical protein